MNARYLIINAYSARNAGDAAIVLATVALLRKHGGSDIRSATRYFRQDHTFYALHGIQVVPPIVPFTPRPRHGAGRGRVLALVAGGLAAFFIVMLHRLTPALARRLAQRLGLVGVLELLAADRVIVCGGGYLYSSRRALNLTLVHATVTTKLAQLARKAPLMMPQSIGPLPRSFDRRLVSWGYATVRPIVVRDDLALRDALTLLPATNPSDIHVCPDIAFAGWPTARPVTKALTQRQCVGIVVMDWTWARNVDRSRALDAYVAKLAQVSGALAARGLRVQLYGHSRVPEMDQDDIEVAERVAQLAGDPSNVQIGALRSACEVSELRELFSALSVVIGTRLHSCITAMSAGTPALALGYQPKSLGTFKLLGLDEYCFDVENFSVDRVVEVTAELVEGGAGQRQLFCERVANAQHRIEAFYARHLP